MQEETKESNTDYEMESLMQEFIHRVNVEDILAEAKDKKWVQVSIDDIRKFNQRLFNYI